MSPPRPMPEFPPNPPQSQPEPHPPLAADLDRLGCWVMGAIALLAVAGCGIYVGLSWRESMQAPPPAKFGPVSP